MAHFAEIDSNNVVIRVLVVSNNDIIDASGQEQEKLGIELLQRLFGAETRWVQTSYKGRIRGTYAGPGMIYDQELDEFLLPSASIMERARDPETGRYIGDDPETPQNEAWIKTN